MHSWKLESPFAIHNLPLHVRDFTPGLQLTSPTRTERTAPQNFSGFPPIATSIGKKIYLGF